MNNMRFKDRSNQKEFLDGDNINKEDLFQNLKELHIINKYLGGYNASIKGIKHILKSKYSIHSIMDIGCGGGDSISVLNKLSIKLKKKIYYYGVDLKQDCIEYSKINLSKLDNVKLIQSDYRDISNNLLSKIDIIHCSLFTHHLKNEEIITLFLFAKENNCILLINDLQRNPIAYYSIKYLTKLFSKSFLVKNDAPISVLRGFKKQEIKDLLLQSGISNYSIQWSWAFRYIVIANI